MFRLIKAGNLQSKWKQRNEALERDNRRLQASDVEFRRMFEMIGEGIAEVDARTKKFLRVNARMCQMTGYTASELLCMTFTELTHPDDREVSLAAYRRVSEQRLVQNEVEKRYIRKNGDTIWVAVKVTPIYAGDALPLRTVAIIQDITSRKLAEAERDRLFDTSRDLLCVFGSDGYFKRVNPAFEQTLGYSAAELLATPIMEFVHPEDRATTLGAFARVAEGGAVLGFENRYIRQDGNICWLSWHSTPTMAGHALNHAIARDVTAAKIQQEALANSEEFSRSTVDALSANIAILDDQGKILTVNKAWRSYAAQNSLPAPDVLTHSQHIAQNPHDSIGTNYLEVCDGATGECAADAWAVAKGIRSVIRGDCNSFSLEYPCHSPTQQMWFLVRVSRFDGPGPVRLVVAHENVTERRLAQDRLLHNSLHDALTGLPNRILFQDRVQRCIERGQREANYHFAAMFLDLDGFKHINDSLGHAVGDKLLVEIAGRLRACLRGTDSLCRIDDAADSTVARMGGDEFTILLDKIRQPQDAARVAERIEVELTHPCTIDGHEVFVGASIGIVQGDRSYRTADELMRDADAAMYRAKTTGKGSYALFDAALHERAMVRLTLENDLRRALDRGELLLHYQPIVELATRELVGFEALIRWRREGKLISPADFIPVAEDTGLIVPIGGWVLNEACRQLQRWRLENPKMANVTMSVNLSRRQFADPELVNRVRDVLQETNIGARSLKLEITESVVMEDTESAHRILTDIKELGVGMQMDDFGTGYSSLSCLNRFPLDGLKIDRSFIREISQKKESMAVLQAIVTLARTLGMKVVAEGVELGEQVALLEGLDCQYVQGFYFSRPLTPDVAAAFFIPASPLAMSRE